MRKEFNEKGEKLFDKQQKLLDELIEKTENKTENQMKMLKNTILQRIALYKLLTDEETFFYDTNGSSAGILLCLQQNIFKNHA